VFGTSKPFQLSVIKRSSLLGRKKWSVVNTVPGTVFSTLHFHLNLRMGPLTQSVALQKAKKIYNDQQSSLVHPFLGSEVKEM
jgi:hypothetical protein